MVRFKGILLASTLLTAIMGSGQNPQLNKLWETDSTLKVPESVLYYAPQKILFISNIDGDPAEKDSSGFISTMGIDCRIIREKWAVGLNAPKGLGIYNNQLFVADISDVVVIDMDNGKIVRRIPIEGARFLNDLAIDRSGIIYVSDSQTGKVHRIENSCVSSFIENKHGVNGLLAARDGKLYMIAKGILYKADQHKNITPVTTDLHESSDGIVKLDGNNFLISCWNGMIYHVNPYGYTQIIAYNPRNNKINMASVGFDWEDNILYVPTLRNKVVAYQISDGFEALRY